MSSISQMIQESGQMNRTSNFPSRRHESVEFFPDRVFVGGFPEDMEESTLAEFFAKYVPVIEAKILRCEGATRGYGFLTLKNEYDANKIKNLSSEKLYIQGHKLNVGPARKRVYTAYPRTGLRNASQYACVTSDGYFPPGAFTFRFDKYPHFIPHSSPQRQYEPLLSSSTSQMNSSFKGNTFLPSKREIIDLHEPNNNIEHALSSNYCRPSQPHSPQHGYGAPVNYQERVEPSLAMKTMVNPYWNFPPPQFNSLYLPDGDGPRKAGSQFSNNLLPPMTSRAHIPPFVKHSSEFMANGLPYATQPMGEVYLPRNNKFDSRRFDFSGRDSPKNSNSNNTLTRKTCINKEPDTVSLKQKMDQLLLEGDATKVDNNYKC